MKHLPKNYIDSEELLKTMSAIIIWLGLIGGIIYAIGSMFVEKPGYYGSRTEFSIMGLCSGIAVIIEVIAASVLLKVIAEISITLKRLLCTKDNTYFIEETSIPEATLKIRKSDGLLVYCYYRDASKGYYKDAETKEVVQNIDESDLEDYVEPTKDDILKRPSLNVAEETIAAVRSRNYFSIGDEVLVKSLNDIRKIYAFTEQKHVILTDGKTIKAHYIDDIKMLE